MTAVSKNVCFDVLDDIVDKYNKTVQRTIKMKPITLDSYTEYNENSNETKPKFNVCDRAMISKQKNIFAKGCTQNQLLAKLKRQFCGLVISDLNGEPITKSFYEKQLHKTSQENFRIQKAINRKGDKLYVNWKEYNNSFNNWVDKKDLERNFIV